MDTCSLCLEELDEDADGLRTHYSAVHLRYFPFACSHCDCWFASRKKLEQHYEMVHPKQPISRINCDPKKCLEEQLNQILSAPTGVETPTSVVKSLLLSELELEKNNGPEVSKIRLMVADAERGPTTTPPPHEQDKNEDSALEIIFPLPSVDELESERATSAIGIIESTLDSIDDDNSMDEENKPASLRRIRRPCPCTDCYSSDGIIIKKKKGMGRRYHPCPKCGKTFGRVQHLRVHMSYHDDIKQLPCSWSDCLMRFAQKDDLKRHLVKHTGEKKFACEICEASFARKLYVRRHHFKHHIPLAKPTEKIRTMI